MNMSQSISKVSNALGGKTARACDSCLVKRARWYCAADDAFLCQSCDASVHTANQLANRHERVRLETTSSAFKVNKEEVNNNLSPSSLQAPTWHQGFTRKARTPRNHAKSKQLLHPPANQTLPLVPEINAEDPFVEENNEGQFIFRVPVFDPFAEDFFNEELADDHIEDGGSSSVANMLLDDDEGCLDLNLAELLGTCDEELFAADVESLLGGSTAGTIDNEEKNNGGNIDEYFLDEKGIMKVEEDDDGDGELVACPNYGGEEMKLVSVDKTTSDDDDMSIRSETHQANMRNMFLRLNYEAVIAAWATQGSSPWTTGTRPQFDIDQFMAAACSGGLRSERIGGGNNNDAEREARVLRYKEKRRTRLFSKKIRYQVRKLNAENRPRMKGRFVKRSTFSASSISS